MEHLIKKQELLLRVAPGLEPFGVQHAASGYYRERLLPVLERVFDELSAEDEVILINRLVIDIGRITEKDLRGTAPREELYESIKKEVLRVVRGERPDAGLSRAALRENALSQWWYYMEKGRLPWNVTRVTADWYRQVLELLSVDYDSVTRLRSVLGPSGVFLQRLCYQHPDEFLETLAGILTGSRQHMLQQRVEDLCFIVRWLEKRYHEGMDITVTHRSGHREERLVRVEALYQWREEHAALLRLPDAGRKAAVWQALLRAAAVRPEEMKARGAELVLLRSFLMPGEGVIRGLLQEAGLDLLALWEEDDPGRASEEKREIAGGERGTPLEGPGNRAPEKGFGEKERGAVISDASVAAGSGGGASAGSNGAAAGEEDQAGATISPEAVDADGLYGRHAGLVLLHPFLATFFTRCGLWDGGGFVSLEARQQAVFLLHYLATGEKEAPEYELLFPKLFCGYAWEMPLPGRMEIPESAFGEGEMLLQNVLQRWEKLKNTSATGLREGFLQRTGKLINRSGRMVLLMEMSAIDVLLDYLPWGLSIVKLPWLKELVFVEWR